jgi:DNA-binding winged helix-turn-helix (wHTH) protein
MKSPAGRRVIYRFGLFEFDPRSGELRKNGLRVRLSQQSSKLLNVLINSDGRLCTRGELRQELWPADTFVDFEHSLNKAVWGLRQALGDFVASPRYIETVAGQGYRFLVSPQNGQSVSQTGRARTLESLAVIPPANPAGSEEGGFFTSQVASRLTNKLCGLAKLRVLAYSTVKQYDLAGLDPRAAGNQLGVDAVLTGEIVQRNGDVIITLELIDTTDGTHIWGTQLKEVWPQAADRTEQIADEIVQQLRPTLARIRKGNTANGSAEAKPSKGRLGILSSPLFRPRIRAKKAFLFA